SAWLSHRLHWRWGAWRERVSRKNPIPGSAEPRGSARIPWASDFRHFAWEFYDEKPEEVCELGKISWHPLNVRGRRGGADGKTTLRRGGKQGCKAGCVLGRRFKS